LEPSLLAVIEKVWVRDRDRYVKAE
jgi:hypothetical protein